MFNHIKAFLNAGTSTDGDNTVGLTHTYQSIGQYSMDVFIGDGSSDITMGVQVHIRDSLPAVDFYQFTQAVDELVSDLHVYTICDTWTIFLNYEIKVSNYRRPFL